MKACLPCSDAVHQITDAKQCTSVSQCHAFISSLYARLAPAGATVSLLYRQFKQHLTNSIPVYCDSCLWMRKLHRRQGTCQYVMIRSHQAGVNVSIVQRRNSDSISSVGAFGSVLVFESHSNLMLLIPPPVG